MDLDTNPMEPIPSSSPTPFFGFALAAIMAFAISFYAVRNGPVERAAGDCYEQENQPGEQGPSPHAKWEKPLVALVLSGQMHGYYDPCGCSYPQHGGLTRRYNFIQSLKARQWDVVGIDLGELPSLKGIRDQNLLKYDLSVKALATMNYRAMGIGLDETLLPLGTGLAKIWDKNKPHPRPLNLSLDKTAPGQTYHDDLNVRQYEIIGGDATPKIGVISMMGPDLRDELKNQEKFLNNLDELPKALKEFAKAGVEIGVILHHEYPKVDEKKFPPGFLREKEIEKQRKLRATKCAEICDAERKKNPKIPPIHLMMVLTSEPEPPSVMGPLSDKLPTQLVEIGHKGRYVGLLGVYRKGKELSFRYELVMMSPEWETKKGQPNPVIGLVESYNMELKRLDMLAKFPRTLHFNQIQPQGVGGLKTTYVGSDACRRCHPDAFKIWEQAPGKGLAHFTATKTLEDEKNPAGRQYDPECMMCHTTGFKHHGGYNDLVTDPANWPTKPAKAPSAKKIMEHNQNLRGVGCESCHGPGGEHARLEDIEAKGREALYPFINPYRLSKEERLLEIKADKKTITADESQQLGQLFDGRMRDMGQKMCMKCHDMENDVNFGTKKGHEVGTKWRPLVHRMMKNNAGAAIPLPMNPPAVLEPPLKIEIIQDKKN